MHRGGLKPLLPHLPSSGLEGKFSLPYTVARALRTGLVRLADFSDEAVHDPGVRSLMDAVVVREGVDPDDPASTEPFTVLTVRTGDGGTRTRRVDVSRGDSRNPLTPAELEDKAVDAFASVGWTPGRTRALLSDVTARWRGGDLAGLQNVLAGRPVTTPAPVGRAEA